MVLKVYNPPRFHRPFRILTAFHPIQTGKTEVFSGQIESLQKDLQPWAAKIAEKQAAIDLAANERDLLVEKTEGIQTAIEEAETALEKLENGDKEKVR